MSDEGVTGDHCQCSAFFREECTCGAEWGDSEWTDWDRSECSCSALFAGECVCGAPGGPPKRLDTPTAI